MNNRHSSFLGPSECPPTARFNTYTSFYAKAIAVKLVSYTSSLPCGSRRKDVPLRLFGQVQRKI
jgi:hypothetical protein